ncbi:mannose-6-phosphate isomerase class I [Neobacillus niacini]|nr:mannose-6-phosphate isomerase class I [Neobacillus niacini]
MQRSMKKSELVKTECWYILDYKEDAETVLLLTLSKIKSVNGLL